MPGASRSRIAGAYGDGIKVTVTAAPERGAANAAVIELLADVLQLPRASVSIISGPTNPRKEVLIVGLDPASIEQRLMTD
ncbi:MAG: DUF167 domain-containing protein [Planctomycetaceae bacterium]|nr:DUF167 domain-containing protein [Planctomycetaceae bacterium]